MKKDIGVAAIVVAVVVALSFGLAKWRPDVPMNPTRPFGEGKKSTTGAKKAVDGKVIMHVNGEPVTEAEFAAFIQSVPEQQRQFFATPPGRRALADEITRVKLLEQEAEKLGFDDDPEVAMRLGVVRSQLLASRALEKLVTEKLDPAIEAEYQKEKGGAKTLHHILVAYQGGQFPAKRGKPALPLDQAMARAGELAAKIRGGADFAQVARAESDDEQSAMQGGAIGPTKPEMLPEDIAKVVAGLQPGKISDPVKTQFGVQIFKVTVPTLDDLRPILAQQVQQKLMMETLAGLQKNAKVELDEKFFPPMEERQPQPGQPQPGQRPPARPRVNS